MAEYDVALFGGCIELLRNNVQADSPEEAAEAVIEEAVDLYREKITLEVWPADSPVMSPPVYVVD